MSATFLGFTEPAALLLQISAALCSCWKSDWLFVWCRRGVPCRLDITSRVLARSRFRGLGSADTGCSVVQGFCESNLRRSRRSHKECESLFFVADIAEP